MSRKIWEINGLSLELDLEDVETLERYEDAFAKMAEDEKAIPKEGKKSAVIRAYCEMYRRLYDRLFGEGTSDKIFADTRLNAEAYENVYFSFLEFAHNQADLSSKRKAEMLMKYKPQNRQQRRAVKK